MIIKLLLSLLVNLLMGLFYMPSAIAAELESTNVDIEKKEFNPLTVTPATERIVFTTSEGDLVFALYPNLAPNHVKQVKKLVELELYDTVHVARVIQDFVFQFSEIHKKPAQSKQQQAALHSINAEFTTEVKHLRGILSMAHQNGAPDSGTNSFSIILGNAAHLDGKYTIFGELESGWKVINKVLASSINGVTPSRRVYVKKAQIVPNINEYYKTHPRDTDTYVAPRPKTKKVRKTISTRRVVKTDQGLIKAVAVLTAMNILIAMLAILFFNKWSKVHLRSLMTLIVLVSGFSLLTLLLSIETEYTWLGAVFFIVLIGMFRVMSRFEN